MKERLMIDLKESMKNKETVRKNTIILLKSAIMQVEKDTQNELKEDEIFAIVAKEVKKRKDSISDYEKAGREDIIAQLNEEMDILSAYLPKQLTNEEIEKLVETAISQTGAIGQKDMGKVMQTIKPEISGRADGKVVSDIVKEKLSQI